MNRVTVYIVSLFVTQFLVHGSEILPRKGNMVSNLLNKTLNSLFDDLATNGISIPEVNLGDDIRFANVKGIVSGQMSKKLDGFKSFGFTLNMTLSEITLSGSYDIKNLVIPGLFPVFGKGDFRIFLDPVSLDMLLSADYYSVEEKFMVAIPKFDVFIEKSTVHFENLMNDTFVADFLNELISNLIPDLVSVFAKPIIEILEPVIDFYGNGIITCIKKESLTGKLNECIRNLFEVTLMKIVETLPPNTGMILN